MGESGPEDREGMLSQLRKAKERIKALRLALDAEKDSVEKQRIQDEIDTTEKQVQILEEQIRDREVDTT